jgi:hypothetical protein
MRDYPGQLKRIRGAEASELWLGRSKGNLASGKFVVSFVLDLNAVNSFFLD